jgi:hypothetical protein
MGFLVRDEISRVTSASPEVCYQTLTQSQNVNAWWRGVQSRLEGPCPWVAGTKLFFQGSLKTPRWVSEIKEAIPNQLIEAYYIDGDFRGAESWEFEPVGDGARVVHRWRGIEAATYAGRALRFTFGNRLHSYLFSGALDGLERLSSP